MADYHTHYRRNILDMAVRDVLPSHGAWPLWRYGADFLCDVYAPAIRKRFKELMNATKVGSTA